MTRLKHAIAAALLPLGIATGGCAPVIGPLHDPRPFVYGTSPRPAAGVWLGPSDAGDSSAAGHSGPSLAVTLETPVTTAVFLRAQITRMWGLNDSPGVPTSLHDVKLRHIVLDGILSAPLNSARITPYGGFGFGWYNYDYAEHRRANQHVTGLHATGGLEIPIDGRRMSLNAEVQVHVIDHAPTEFGAILGSILGGMKVRF